LHRALAVAQHPAKAASDSVRELVVKVSVLPPLARHVTQALSGFNVSGMAFG